MSAFPAAAAAIPLPEPMGAVVTVTFGYRWWYAAVQVLITGASNVLPASDSDCGPWAGPVGITPPGAAGAAGESAIPLPLHAVARASGTMMAAASSTRDLSGTGHSLTVPEPACTRASPCLASRAGGSLRLGSNCPWPHCALGLAVLAPYRAGRRRKRFSAAAAAHAVVLVSG